MNTFFRVASTLVGALMVFSLLWVLVGFSVRVVKELFCWGYGC